MVDRLERPERIAWEIPVLDIRDRDRTLVVVIADGHVVMLSPTYEAWTVPPESHAALVDAIREARRIAVSMREPS